MMFVAAGVVGMVVVGGGGRGVGCCWGYRYRCVSPAASQKAQLLAQFDADGGGIGDDDDTMMMLDSDGAGLVQGEDDLEDFESVQPIPKPRVSVSDGCEAPVASRSRRGGSAVS